MRNRRTAVRPALSEHGTSPAQTSGICCCCYKTKRCVLSSWKLYEDVKKGFEKCTKRRYNEIKRKSPAIACCLKELRNTVTLLYAGYSLALSYADVVSDIFALAIISRYNVPAWTFFSVLFLLFPWIVGIARLLASKKRRRRVLGKQWPASDNLRLFLQITPGVNIIYILGLLIYACYNRRSEDFELETDHYSWIPISIISPFWPYLMDLLAFVYYVDDTYSCRRKWVSCGRRWACCENTERTKVLPIERRDSDSVLHDSDSDSDFDSEDSDLDSDDELAITHRNNENRAKNHAFVDAYVTERLFVETIFESLPQAILQIYIYSKCSTEQCEGHSEDGLSALVVSITFSFVQAIKVLIESYWAAGGCRFLCRYVRSIFGAVDGSEELMALQRGMTRMLSIHGKCVENPSMASLFETQLQKNTKLYRISLFGEHSMAGIFGGRIEGLDRAGMFCRFDAGAAGPWIRVVLDDENVERQIDANDRELENVKALRYFPSLERLYLSQNKLSAIGPLEHMEHLCILDLRDNNLKSRHAKSLKLLTSLEKLDLAGNKIKSLYGWLCKLKNLVWLDLSNNRVQSLHAIRELDKLEYLYVESQERLKELRLGGSGGKNWGGLSNLKELSILDNPGIKTFEAIKTLPGHSEPWNFTLFKTRGMFNELQDVITELDKKNINCIVKSSRKSCLRKEVKPLPFEA